VKSNLTEGFLEYFGKLPDSVKQQARKSYKFWKQDPYYPSLHFKQVHTQEPVYSIRIGRGWRALGLLENDTLTWFWIGSHADYDRLLSQL
jgi:hypothetical protein